MLSLGTENGAKTIDCHGVSSYTILHDSMSALLSLHYELVVTYVLPVEAFATVIKTD